MYIQMFIILNILAILGERQAYYDSYSAYNNTAGGHIFPFPHCPICFVFSLADCIFYLR